MLSAFGRPPMPTAACNIENPNSEREITMDMNMILDDIPDVLTVNEASEILGVCSKTCCKLIKENQLYGVKVGRSYRIAKIELLKFLKIIPTDDDQSG